MVISCHRKGQGGKHEATHDAYLERFSATCGGFESCVLIVHAPESQILRTCLAFRFDSGRQETDRENSETCRLMLGQRYTINDDALNVLDLPSLEERRERLTKKFAGNLTKETSPFYHWLPPMRASRTSRNLRNANDYSEIKCKNERYRKSALPFIVRYSIQNWNKVKTDLLFLNAKHIRKSNCYLIDVLK